jgi:integration host factor subunit beta
MSFEDARKVVESFAHCVAEELAHGGRLEIRGLGAFGLRHRASSRRANPRTGELNLVPGRFMPRFKASKKILKGLNDQRG